MKRFINKLGTQGITKKTLCRGRIICEGMHPFETHMRFTFVQAQRKKRKTPNKNNKISKKRKKKLIRKKKLMPWSHNLVLREPGKLVPFGIPGSNPGHGVLYFSFFNN